LRRVLLHLLLRQRAGRRVRS